MLFFVFKFAGAAATYMRFFSYIKKNYDYRVVIFLLTFTLITVSSEDHHHSNVSKLKGLAKSIQGIDANC
jgi:hypothetical protein